METSNYVVIRQRGTAIELQGTDPGTIHQLFNVLALSVEGLGVSASKLPTSRVFYWRLYGFSGRLEHAWQLLAEQLASRGWQPCDAPERTGPGGERVICFGLGGEV